MHDLTDPRVAGRGRPVALLLATLLLASCTGNGGDPSPSPSAREEKQRDNERAADETASMSATPTEPVLDMARFDTPSGNIHCQSFSTSLLCVIDSGLVPEPSHDFCPVDWIGVFIEVGEYAGPGCSGDPGIEPTAAAVVPYGRTWSRAGVTCMSEKTGLTCEDTSGNGFTLARAGWELLGKESAARAAFGELRKMVRSEARREFGSDVQTVSAPALGGGDDCGPLQPAFVDLTVLDRPVIYEACFVSGSWYIEDGPLFPD